MKYKMLRKTEPSESEIQCAIFEWACRQRYAQGFIGDYLIKITNEGKRTRITGHRMKMEGLKAGVSDLFLAIPTKKLSGLWIEIKKEGGALSYNQILWLERMILMGYGAFIAYSVDKCINAIKGYLGMR